MFPFARRRERVVEANREVADEQVAGVGEFRGGRITRVTRSSHVIFLHQIQIDGQCAHLKFLTVSTRAEMFSSFASGGTP
jgi:hypothetical protein